MQKQARRERNYQKLSDFQNRIRSVLIPNMEDKMSQLWNIYQDAIVEFENTDDMYHDKAAFYYDMWSDFGDGITDHWRGTKDVLRGAVDAVTELGEGLLVLAMWSPPVVRVGQLFGMLPEYAEEKVAEMDAGILQLLQDPVNTLGAIGQNMADTVDEEGLAYGISYVAADVAVEILLEKGLGNNFYDIQTFCSEFTRIYDLETDYDELSVDENQEFGDLCEMAGRFSKDEEELKIPNMYFSENNIMEKAKYLIEILKK